MPPSVDQQWHIITSAEGVQDPHNVLLGLPLRHVVCANLQDRSTPQPEEHAGLAGPAAGFTTPKLPVKSSRKSKAAKQKAKANGTATDAAEAKPTASSILTPETAPAISSTSTIQIESRAAPAHSSQAEPKAADLQPKASSPAEGNGSLEEQANSGEQAR